MTLFLHCEMDSTCHLNSPLSLAPDLPSPVLPKVSPAAQQPLLTQANKIVRENSGAIWKAKRTALSDMWPVRQLNRM